MRKIFSVAAVLFSVIFLTAHYSSAEETNPEKLMNGAGLCLHSGQFDKAIKLYEKALTRAENPKVRSSALLGLSSSYLEKGLEVYSNNKDRSYYQKSIEYADECLKIFPDQWQALGNIGTVYMNMCEHGKAAAYYKRALACADKKSKFYGQLKAQNDMNNAELAEHGEKD